MKKLSRLLLSFVFALCCMIGIAACSKDETEKFDAPAGFAFDGKTMILSFDKVEGAEAYNAKVLSENGTIVYENKALKTEKIELADKKLTAGNYTANVMVNATESKAASDTAEYKFVVTKTELETPVLTVAASANGTTVSWTADSDATAGYKARLKKDGATVKEYTIEAGKSALEINREDATKNVKYTLEVYAAATADLKQSQTASVEFTQSLPAIQTVENLQVNDFVATWDKAEEATNGYTVTVYKKNDEGKKLLENEQVAQSDGPSFDLSALKYAAETEYTVSVVVNAVENEYTASLSETADYTSASVWIFADEADKDAFFSHGPSVDIVDGKLQLSEPRTGANVVRFKHHFNVGDKITISMKTKRLWIYGNSKTDNAAHVVQAFAYGGKVPDQVGWNEANEKEDTLVLVVMKEIEGLFMDMDAEKNIPVIINSLKIEAGANVLGSYVVSTGAGANAGKTQDGIKLSCVDGNDKCATVIMPKIKAGSAVEVTYGAVTATEGNGKFFIYGVNGNYDTLIVKSKKENKDVTVLRRNGNTNDLNTETIGGNFTASYTTDYDIYGLRFDFGGVGTSVEIKNIRVIESKNTWNFTSADDEKWFSADGRVNDAEKQMNISVVDTDNVKALNVKSVNGSNMLVFSFPLKAGSKITIDVKSKACFVYGKGSSDSADYYLDMDAVSETEISGDGTRHSVELNVNADCVGLYIMFNAAAHTDADGSFIYSITITPPQA